MDFKTAVEILELDPNNVTPENIKKAYKRLSLKYHPDVSNEKDGSKFILINAAYEFLIKNISFIDNEEFRETEDELKKRIELIKRAFENMKNEYVKKHNDIFQKMVNDLISTLDSYSSKKELEEKLNQDFIRIVENGIEEIVYWFNTKIKQIIYSYDEWINGYLRSTYESLRRDEFKNWYKSNYFYSHLIPSLIIAFIFYVFYLSGGSEQNPGFIFLSFISIFSGIVLYIINVNSKYSFKENIKTLDMSKFKVNPKNLMITTNDSISVGESALGFGAVGALIGAIGGPLGAILGGVLGGFIGALFGETLDTIKEKMFYRLIDKLKEIENVILKNLDDQIPKIEKSLIDAINDNFNRNKQRAVKLLLSSKK